VGAAWHPAARVWLARHWPPHGIRLGAVRPGAVQASVWLRAGVAGRSGSERIGCGHAGMWPLVHRPILCLRLRSYVLDQMSTRKTAARNDLTGDESHGAWASSQHGATTWNSVGLLGSKGAKTGVGGRRGESGAGAGAATAARRGCWCPLPVRGASESWALWRT
jgi:hypothetical protein